MDMEGADVLVDILRCLRPRSLAAARCFCKAWRAVVDDHLLLRADLLPRSLNGIIYETVDESDNPRLFARRSIARHISGGLNYLGVKEPGFATYDSCNGLVLLRLEDCYHVVNPATRQWAQLPPPKHTCPGKRYCGHCSSNLYLMYDPTISPHYEFIRPMDIVEILKIQTSPRQREDFIAWQPETTASCTVSSAYCLAMYDHEEPGWFTTL
ncbi:hypothetical protein D1007_47230 [Hordeum vulgare]|nr:hypothetical protein D1007_47230 [Hordeum vulgare]